MSNFFVKDKAEFSDFIRPQICIDLNEIFFEKLKEKK